MSLIWMNASNYHLLFRMMFGDVLQWGYLYQIGAFDIYLGEVLLAIGIIVFFGLLVCFVRKIAVYVLTIFAILMAVAVAIVFVGVFSHADFSSIWAQGSVSNVSKGTQIYHILLLAPWMFIGFESIAMVSGDYRFPAKKSNFIMPFAIGMGFLMYVGLNFIGAAALPVGFESNANYIANLELTSGMTKYPVMFSAMETLGGTGKLLIEVAMFCALTTSMIGCLCVMGNLCKAMSDIHLIPKRYGEVSKDGIPQRALILIILISMLIPFFGRTAVSWLTDATAISVTIAYTYTSLCCYMRAKKEGDVSSQRLGVIGLAISAAFFLLPLLTSMFVGSVFATESYVILAIWGFVGLGIIIWFNYVKIEQKPKA